jgi:hypothetical protein
MFFNDRLVSEGAAKLCWLLQSWGTLSHFMVKSAGGECHGSRDLSTRKGDLSLCGDEELA